MGARPVADERVQTRFEHAGERIRCIVEVADASLYGHSAEFRLARKVVVKDSKPVHASDVVFRARIEVVGAQNIVEIPREQLRAYSYRGTLIDIELHTELKIDDGLIFDTLVREEQQIAAGLKPAISTDARGIVEPEDAFDFIANLKAIPPANQLLTLLLMIVGGIVIAFNTWLGWHDQMAPDHLTFLYSHRDSDGDSQSPLMTSLMASGAFGAAVWYAIRRQLRQYMSFEVTGVPGRIGIGDRIPAARLVRGKARVDLNDVVVRIVGCNMERGQYKRRSGSKERTVSFNHPVRAVILYEKRLERVPAHLPLERYLDGDVAFDAMFRALYPPQPVGREHGLSVHWEVQLIHDELVDQEIVCRNDCFVWSDFLKS